MDKISFEREGERKLLCKPRLKTADKVGRINLGKEFANRKVLMLVAEPEYPFDEIYWTRKDVPAFVEQSDGNFIPNPQIKEIDEFLNKVKMGSISI